MQAVIQSLFAAFRQLTDPAITRLLAKTVAITVVLFVLVGGVLGYGVYRVLIAWDVWGGGAGLAGLIAFLLTAIGIWLWLRVVAVAVLQFFADDVVAAVEARHYPDAARSAIKLPLKQEVTLALRGMGRTIGVNLLALPFVAVLIVTGIGPAVLLIVVNGWLLGRELTDMAWLRHCGDAPQSNPVSRGHRFALGTCIAALMVVPFAGLIAPIIGAAAGTHLMQAARAEGE